MEQTLSKLCYHPSFCNTYVLGGEGEPALIVDPGYNKSGALNRYLEKHHQGKVLGVFLTHGHFDHFLGLNEMENPSSFPTFLCQEDEPCLLDPKKNASFSLSTPEKLEKEISPYFVEDEDEIKIGPYQIKVIHTPFHTKGSCCFLLKGSPLLFTGDTLFHLGVGRDDLPWAEPKAKENSLNKLLSLPDELKILPGHGPSSTLGAEKKYFPSYLLD